LCLGLRCKLEASFFACHKHDYKLSTLFYSAHHLVSVHYVRLFFLVPTLLFIVLLLVIDVHHVVSLPMVDITSTFALSCMLEFH
jgi:hypothetical protein